MTDRTCARCAHRVHPGCPDCATRALVEAGLLRHTCPLPNGTSGEVWACTCGRRWTCVQSGVSLWGGDFRLNAKWRRRYWPWPRAPRSTS